MEKIGCFYTVDVFPIYHYLLSGKNTLNVESSRKYGSANLLYCSNVTLKVTRFSVSFQKFIDELIEKAQTL